MKAEVRVVGVQFDVRSAADEGVAGRDWNAEFMVEKVREYGLENDLIVFPELANCGYVRALQHESDFRKQFYSNGSESYPDGPTTRAVAQACREADCHAVFGLLQKSEVKYEIYNSSVLVGPSGPIGIYQKVHMPAEEVHYFMPGPGFRVFNTALGKIGLMICYDMWFPESARILTLSGAEIIVEIANWFVFKNSVEWWKAAAMARAIENQVHLVAVNRVGDFEIRPGLEPMNHAPGLSRIINAYGELLAETDGDQELVIEGVLTEEDLERGSHVLPVFRDRVPSAYSVLTRQTHKWGMDN